MTSSSATLPRAAGNESPTRIARADSGARPLKITYLIGSLARGGAEGQLIELLRRLDRSRWQPSLILFENDNADRASGLVDEIHALQIAGSGYSSNTVQKGYKAFKGVVRLTRHLLRIQPTILHAMLPAACILAAPAARIAHVPILIGSRRCLVDSYRNSGWLTPIDRSTIRMCDFVVGNSRAVNEELTRLDGLPAVRCVTVYNGVDAKRFKPGNRCRRQEWGWTEEHVVFGIVANFLPYKRHRDFVRAAALIAAEAPEARFVMAGQDRGILHDLRTRVREAGLESRFVIIPGSTEPEALYPGMDAYICTSETEGFSNVLLEAAACGLPLIATRVGGNPEIVYPGENGFLVPVARPEEVAQAALALVNDRAFRCCLGSRSREIVEQRFSLENMVRQHEMLYEKAFESAVRANQVNV